MGYDIAARKRHRDRARAGPHIDAARAPSLGPQPTRMTAPSSVWPRRRAALLRWWPVLLLVVNLVLLWTARGNDFTGWELVGAAEGVRILHEHSLAEAVAIFWERSRHFQYWDTQNSVVFPVVAGLVGRAATGAWALPLWNAAITLLLLLVVGRRLFTAPASDVLWCLVACPVLLNHLLVGFPYISATWAPLLTLALLDARRDRADWRSFLAELPLWLVIGELALHCYEPGRSYVFLPVLAALFATGVRWPRRVFWLAVGAAAFVVSVYVVPSTISGRIATAVGAVGIEAVLGAAFDFARGLFVEWYSDIPVLMVAAALAAVLCRRDRWFWMAAVGLQVAFAVAEKLIEPLGAGRGLRPRRFILLDLYALLLCLAALRASVGSQGRPVLLSLLFVGQLLTLGSTVAFWRSPTENRSLPWVHSPVDFFVDRSMIADAARLADLVESTRLTTVLLYGYSFRPENTTDPIAVPERLYLQLGPQRFAERVRMLDPAACRYACLPSSDLRPLLETLTHPDPFWLVVPRDVGVKPFPLAGARDWPSFQRRYLSTSELVEMPMALRHFRVFLVATPRPPAVPDFGAPAVPTVAASPARPGRDGLCARPYPPAPFDWMTSDPLTTAGAPLADPIPVDGRDPLPLRTPAVVLFGDTYVAGDRDVPCVFLLAAQGNAVVEIDGQLLAQRLRPEERATPIGETLALTPGPHSLRVYLTMLPVPSQLRIAFACGGDPPPIWSCEQEVAVDEP